MSARKDESGRFMASPGKRVVVLLMEGDPAHAEAVRFAFRDSGRKAEILWAQKPRDDRVLVNGDSRN